MIGLIPNEPTELKFQIQTGVRTDENNNRVPVTSDIFLEVQTTIDRRPSYDYQPGGGKLTDPLICRVLGDGDIPDEVMRMAKPVAEMTYQGKPGRFEVMRFLKSDVGGHLVSGSRIYGVFVPN